MWNHIGFLLKKWKNIIFRGKISLNKTKFHDAGNSCSITGIMVRYHANMEKSRIFGLKQ